MFRKKLLVALAICGFGVPAFAQGKPSVQYGAPPNISPASGAEMYRAYCAVCHGLDGKGGGPAAPALKQTPSDLTQISKKNGGNFPEFRVAGIIQGDAGPLVHGTKEMPMWGDVFRGLQRDDTLVKMRVHNLTEYISSIQQK